MKYSLSLHHPLRSILWSDHNYRYVYYPFLVLIGGFLLSFSSQLVIPLQPVPITLQSFTVLLLGMIYGSRLGLASVIFYIAAGMIGIPVFAQSFSGAAVLFGSSGGYLLGFIPAAYLSGMLVEKGWGATRLGAVCAALAGVSLIFVFGISVLTYYAGLQKAFILGLIPFVPGEIIKVIALMFIVPLFWKKS